MLQNKQEAVLLQHHSLETYQIDILAFKSGKSISVQVKSAKTGNITVANVERDYLILKQEGNFQRVIAKKEMPQWKKDLIFVIVFIGENLGEDRFYIWENSSIQEIFLAIINLCFKRIMV